MHKHRHKHVTPLKSDPTGPGMPMNATSGGNHPNGVMVSADEIRLCAYRKWESAGRPAGDGFQFWLEAEQELGCRNHGGHN